MGNRSNPKFKLIFLNWTPTVVWILESSVKQEVLQRIMNSMICKLRVPFGTRVCVLSSYLTCWHQEYFIVNFLLTCMFINHCKNIWKSFVRITLKSITFWFLQIEIQYFINNIHKCRIKFDTSLNSYRRFHFFTFTYFSSSFFLFINLRRLE